MRRLLTHRLTPILIMFAVLAFEMATDLYLPSLPEMSHYFNVSDAAAQSTLSGYLLGFSLLGLIAGPLSDSIGRRPVILGSMAIFAIGSICCWLAPSMGELIIARVTQGIGAGMTIVVTTAILKDIYDEKYFSRIYSTMGLVITLSPMIAPILGGKIADMWGWKSCFFIIAFIATFIWLSIALSLKESLNAEDRIKLRSTFPAHLLFQTYGKLLKRRETVFFVLISAITYGGLWAWIVEAPFYMINVIGIQSVDYGYYAAIGPVAYILGTLLNRRYVVIYGPEKLLTWGLIPMILGATFALIASIYWPYSLTALYFSFALYSIGLAPVFANAATKAVSVKPSLRGGASALLNTLETAISSLTIFIVSLVSNDTFVPCTIMLLCCTLLCAVMFTSTIKYGKKTEAAPSLNS
ncbi:MAG: multidrug effflux MFS transporter [Alphaproteobacteria bacterium]|nr:multidrug effflux MFS transporter [Alphaproteobacteria bacterium]